MFLKRTWVVVRFTLSTITRGFSSAIKDAHQTSRFEKYSCPGYYFEAKFCLIKIR